MVDRDFLAGGLKDADVSLTIDVLPTPQAPDIPIEIGGREPGR
jgi:hypothetical protein